MDINSFFNQIDDTVRSKEIEQQAKEAEKRVFTQTTMSFANKLSDVVENYTPEFERRGFRCEHSRGNLPYWHYEVTGLQGNLVKVAIVNGYRNDYEIAFYYQGDRINSPLFISDNFDKVKVESELQKLFQKLF